jgi:hypothetical protein
MRLELTAIAAHWQSALEAAERALSAAAGTLPAAYLNHHRAELVRERRETAALLRLSP